MDRFALILTHNRPGLLRECVAAIRPQVDTVIVVDNASDPPVQAMDVPGCMLVHVPDQPPNLAALWNKGFELATGWWGDQPGPFHIAVLCDDAIVPDGWFDAVTDAMTATGAVIGCSDPFGHPHEPRVKTAPDGDIIGRMPGWAWIIDGSKNLRADEDMHFWWCDTDMDWQARQAGGMVMIGGYPVPNMRPNEFLTTVPGLGEQAGRDGEAFEKKHGWRPW